MNLGECSIKTSHAKVSCNSHLYLGRQTVYILRLKQGLRSNVHAGSSCIQSHGHAMLGNTIWNTVRWWVIRSKCTHIWYTREGHKSMSQEQSYALEGWGHWTLVLFSYKQLQFSSHSFICGLWPDSIVVDKNKKGERQYWRTEITFLQF